VVTHIEIYLKDTNGARAWQGYAPGDPVELAFTFFTDADADDLDLCAYAFQAFNVGGGPLADREAPYRALRNRSLSAGDVVVIGGRAYGCASLGFERLENFLP
jgi:hypothetical protein